MKKTILSLVLAMTLILAYAVPVAATEEIASNTTGTVVSEDYEIQAAYDAYRVMEAAYAAYDYTAMKSAVTELEDITSDFDDQQTAEWEKLVEDTVGYQTYFEVALSANAIVNTVDLYESFIADKNAATALAYIKIYEEVTVEWELEVDKYVPGTAAAYEDAKANYLPDENVLSVYNAYIVLEENLGLSCYDEDFFNAYEGFEAVLDTFNELTEEELGDLAVLMGVESAEAAWNKIFGDWINANLVKELGAAYDKYNDNPNADTAKEFVDKYESILNETTVLTDDDKAVILAFFDESVYEGAKELLAPASSENKDATDGTTEETVEPETEATEPIAEPETEATEPETETTEPVTESETEATESEASVSETEVTEPTEKSAADDAVKTGDETNMLVPFVMMLVAAGVAAAAVLKRKRVQ